MDKLYVTLEKASVKSPHDLAIPVQDMTNAIVTLANVTEIISNVMIKSSSSLSGNQYKMACVAATDMSVALIEMNDELFDLQKQIYNLEVKIEEFEHISRSAIPPKRTDIRKIDADSMEVFDFVKEDYITLSNTLGDYVSICDQTANILVRDAEDVGSYWNDPQYVNFVRYINDMQKFIISKATKLEEYKIQLDIDITKM